MHSNKTISFFLTMLTVAVELVVVPTTGAWMIAPSSLTPSTTILRQHEHIMSPTTTCLFDSDAAEPLPFSDSDRARLMEMRERHVTIPIMILDAMLPGQCLSFGSNDPKFHKLIAHVLAKEEAEIGMIGLNPYTGRPLNMGVTLSMTDDSVQMDEDTGTLNISVQGHRRFEVQGEPWMDETNSFYLADVEIVDNRYEPLPEDMHAQAKQISQQIPPMVEEWLGWVIKSGKTDGAGMQARMQDIGPMPEDTCMRERAIWVAALLNPLPALGVCLEIRPAMLACKNDYDRMNLAMASLQSSIDHLSGKRRLF